MSFQTLDLPATPDVTAPDGSDVRVLLKLDGGSFAHFELAAGQTSQAVAHRTVEEIWYVLEGRGEMWRRLDGQEETVPLVAGVCLTLPRGTHFQFRAHGPGPLRAIAATMPAWPRPGEAYLVPGPWTPGT